MPAATMFAKFKSGPVVIQNPVDSNPINQHYEIGKQVASAGPEMVWHIFDAFKKSDGRVSLPLKNRLFVIYIYLIQYIRYTTKK